MAYVPGFQHDVFVSYAVADEEKEHGVETGWITAFMTSLESQLTKLIGRRGRLSVWRDRKELAKNAPIDPQIREALESTACMVVNLSNGYLESDWCRIEHEIFSAAVAKQQRPDSRLFIVDQGMVSDEERRKRFDNILPFEFFKRDIIAGTQLLGYPEPDPKQHPEFYSEIKRLSGQLKSELDKVKVAAIQLEVINHPTAINLTENKINPELKLPPVFPPEPPAAGVVHREQGADRNRGGRRFRVALSFPGLRRQFVREVANHLQDRFSKEEILFDEWHSAELARPNLNVYLPELYRNEAELVVVFLGSEYQQSQWCGLEWRAVMDLIQTANDSKVMLLRFDSADIPGIFRGDGYLDVSRLRPEAVALEIFKRCKIEVDNLDAQADNLRVPAGDLRVRRGDQTPREDREDQRLHTLVADLRQQIETLDESVYSEACQLLRLGQQHVPIERELFVKEILGDFSPKRVTNCLRAAAEKTGNRNFIESVIQIIRRLIPLKFGQVLHDNMQTSMRGISYQFVEGVVGHRLAAEVMVARYDCRPLEIEENGAPRFAFGTVNVPNSGGGTKMLNAGAIALLGDMLAELGKRYYNENVAPTGQSVDALARQLDGLIRNLAEAHYDSTGISVTIHVWVVLPESSSDRDFARKVIEFVSSKLATLMFIELSKDPALGVLTADIIHCVSRKS